MTRNRHRVDLLADVRAEIKLLREREAELRSEILASGEMTGDEHEATLSEFTVERLNLELMKRELGMVFLRPFLREKLVTRLQIRPTTRKAKRAT
jgi:hypothetical protein